MASLGSAWQALATEPGANAGPSELPGDGWISAQVPGTAAGALRDAGAWSPGEPSELDAQDWWFRTRFDATPAGAGEEVVLRLGGIATVSEAFLNGEPILASASMFAEHAIDVGARLRDGANELAICCRALAPLLAVRRRPRARWRSKIAAGNLRFFRTSLLGRAPGIASGPAPVGPWRPVTLERRTGVVAERIALRPRLDGADGVLAVEATLRAVAGGAAPAGAQVEIEGPSGTWRAPLTVTAAAGGDSGAVVAAGELTVPRVARWWPHTHGDPALHAVRILIDGGPAIDAGRTGFRALAAGARPGHDVAADGLDLHVNGVRVFARGAVWTPVDFVGLAPSEDALRAALVQARDAGMNMLRVVGTGAYESARFHDLCDELGILVWQDFMFANFDYPFADEDFRAAVEEEARAVLEGLAGRPSLAVLCGSSEVEQQVAMLALDAGLARGDVYYELLPGLARAADADAVYVPSSPSGGDPPFRPDRGVANYFGVGGYRRPLEDARRAGVRFAGECLAFSHVPGEEALEAAGLADVRVHEPRWKAGVPRDAGAGWDFEDARDHYLALLYGVDPGEVRRVDHERYLELSRAVTGEVVADVFGEWRRAASPCGGGLVLWLRDLAPGAGWGLVDNRGTAKPALHHVRRALAPVAVWTTDEGLNGIAVHVANDRPEPLAATLRVALYRDLEQRTEEASEEVELPAHGVMERDAEALLGRFADVAWAYRFGPPSHDVVVATLERDGMVLSQAFRFPAGRPLVAVSAEALGLAGEAVARGDGSFALRVRSRALAYGVQVHAPGFTADDDAFSVEPGGERVVTLRPENGEATATGWTLTALNLRGRVAVAAGDGSAAQSG